MVLQWRKRAHEDLDNEVTENDEALESSLMWLEKNLQNERHVSSVEDATNASELLVSHQ